MTTFPYGYSGDPAGMGTMLTWDQMLTKSTVNKLNPEVQRRFKALIERAAAEGVPLGCGTGWRVQPVGRPGFASPGNSYHEGFPANNVAGGALAVDTVPSISWMWMENNCAAFGLRTFRNVNQEPWHVQPVEIPTSRNWATVSPPLQTWPLPDSPPPPPTGGTFTLQLQKNELTPAKREQLRHNGDVFLIQQICQGHFKQLGNPVYDCGNPDGDYGPRTQDAVKQLQRDGGLSADAMCGPNTWSYVLNSTGG